MNSAKKTIWIYTFEYAGIAKVGGLGEVPANQAKYLKDKFALRVFIPSHGQIDRLRKTRGIKKLDFAYSEEINSKNLKIEGFSETCMIGYYECEIEGVKIILLSGENEFTKIYLDDKIVYNPDTFTGKLLLFSLGMRAYTDYLIKNKNSRIPDLIHMHDYHVVIPFINTKQELNKRNLDTSSLITIHLLTHPKFDLQFYYACGVSEQPIKILLKDDLHKMTMAEIFELCKRKDTKTESVPSMEKIGAVISDLVTTVSNSYLKSDIIPKLGQELIEFKSDFVWDGCDWDFYDIKSKVLNSLGEEILEVLNINTISDIKRADMKKYLLTYKIGNLEQSPLINSEKVLKAINQISNGNPFIKNGNIKAFSSSGPLMITTGRMSPQKG
ncbi:MAG: hypothetical protein GF353_12135, partial [Candidatus Lokiarchaeota archaeon]|nr:hypothetical protein [Candidatus Lokiarchaeota archaeon]